MKRFYVVWRDPSPACMFNNNPAKRHATYADATAEAERLAKVHPGARFYVLQAKAVCSLAELIWEKLER